MQQVETSVGRKSCCWQMLLHQTLLKFCFTVILAVLAGAGHYLMGSAIFMCCMAGADGEGHSTGFPPAEQAPNDMVQG